MLTLDVYSLSVSLPQLQLRHFLFVGKCCYALDGKLYGDHGGMGGRIHFLHQRGHQPVDTEQASTAGSFHVD
ncbi:hypothetical protein [Bifidobacterium asteroides]|uniref:hypothetical protein n=1 Tax=Bifidobacterium asteroides TaxID=1684 RepID=UPI0011B3A9A1|nr:hypothetical protein [Bifidobacterium asteroides]